ncbi:MAG: hypothetical protein K0B87_04190 [Candidatus Syntrophosphaera sp.]|nr:hypothetical protein [Candidatus Syntrophosphaera sp.]
MPEPRKDQTTKIMPEQEPAGCDQTTLTEDPETGGKEGKKPVPRSPRNFVPIIMSLALFFGLGTLSLNAQTELGLSLQTTYSDNVFQLSEYDLDRFQQAHPNLEYVQTTDDLTIAARVDVAYPFRYKWWKFTPSVTGIVSQNVSNPDKQRRDALLRFRVDRHYWNFTALYGYYPNTYIRSYVDTDGTRELEQYGYERNLYRGDLNLKPLKNTTFQLHARHEQYFYNQYWTEFDGNATTLGLGLRQSFPAFSVGGIYYYRVFDNTNADDEDSSYESNIYRGDLSLKAMPLDENKPRGATWHPSLALSYEERFFQSADNWYGGRVYKIYTTEAGLNFKLDANWNLMLDYSHIFRNVESPVAAVRRAREYGENRMSATVKYSF